MRIGHATSRGMVREVNEDSYLVLTRPAIAPELAALLVVADGMGGHNAGDVASGEVIRLLDGLFSSPRYQEFVGYSREREDFFIVVVKEVLEQINERVHDLAGSRPGLQGMGTTTSLVLMQNGTLFVGHVGDSRIYRLREGRFQLLTQDHRLVSEQVQAGLISEQQAAASAKRNVLTRCIGLGPLLRVDRAAHQARTGDVLLLCTDGLTEVVTDAELSSALMSPASPQSVCEKLVKLANQRGGPDNITVIIAQVAEGSGSDIPGGRAFGPRRGERAATQQADTVKLLPPKGRARSAQRAADPRASMKRGEVGSKVLAGTFITLASLTIALLGTYLMVQAEKGGLFPDWERFHLPPVQTAGVMLMAFVASLLGVGIGFLTAKWLARSKAQRSATHSEPSNANVTRD